ncbi:amidohydrolase family protein [Leifsonia shinshuensis]
MRVIDTHLHCWDQSRFDYAWLHGTDLPWRFTPDDIPDAAGIRAVFMEADRRVEQASAEAEWALGLGHGRPPVVAAVAHAPLGDGDSAVAALESLTAIPGVAGVRRLLQDEPLGFFAHEQFLADLRALGAAGLAFDACVRAPQLRELARTARSAPETVIVLDHLGKPAGEDPAEALRGEWLDGIRALAACDNVVLKVSGLLPPDGPLDAVRPWVLAALEAFGPDRAVVGSDWPVSRRVDIPYPRWFEFVLDECGLSAEEADRVGWRNAERIYRVAS